jgi:hypothetical protein
MAETSTDTTPELRKDRHRSRVTASGFLAFRWTKAAAWAKGVRKATSKS